MLPKAYRRLPSMGLVLPCMLPNRGTLLMALGSADYDILGISRGVKVSRPTACGCVGGAQVKRFDSVTRSPVYASFGAMLKVSACTIMHSWDARKAVSLPEHSNYGRSCLTVPCWELLMWRIKPQGKYACGRRQVQKAHIQTAVCAGAADHQGL